MSLHDSATAYGGAQVGPASATRNIAAEGHYNGLNSSQALYGADLGGAGYDSVDRGRPTSTPADVSAYALPATAAAHAAPAPTLGGFDVPGELEI